MRLTWIQRVLIKKTLGKQWGNWVIEALTKLDAVGYAVPPSAGLELGLDVSREGGEIRHKRTWNLAAEPAIEHKPAMSPEKRAKLEAAGIQVYDDPDQWFDAVNDEHRPEGSTTEVELLAGSEFEPKAMLRSSREAAKFLDTNSVDVNWAPFEDRPKNPDGSITGTKEEMLRHHHYFGTDTPPWPTTINDMEEEKWRFREGMASVSPEEWRRLREGRWDKDAPYGTDASGQPLPASDVTTTRHPIREVYVAEDGKEIPLIPPGYVVTKGPGHHFASGFPSESWANSWSPDFGKPANPIILDPHGKPMPLASRSSRADVNFTVGKAPESSCREDEAMNIGGRDIRVGPERYGDCQVPDLMPDNAKVNPNPTDLPSSVDDRDAPIPYDDPHTGVRYASYGEYIEKAPKNPPVIRYPD